MIPSAQAELQTALAPGSLICLDTNCLLYYFKGEMPWADSLRPVFEAKDGGDVRLFTSSMTLAELLARVDPSDQSAMLSAVRQYFDLVPVDDNIGIQAAGIRRASNVNNAASPPVKTPDAVEMATAGETRSLLFITNDEQLTRMPHTVKALYLKELALDWLDEELNACLSSTVSHAIQVSARVELALAVEFDVSQDLLRLATPLNSDAFVENALTLSGLFKGACGIVGYAQGEADDKEVLRFRVLSASRPWLSPPVPDWLHNVTKAKHQWQEPGQIPYISAIRTFIEDRNADLKKADSSEKGVPYVVVNTAWDDAKAEVNALDGNGQMAPHKKRQEILRRYLAPFKPVMPLLELDGARLWKAEAQNAHELDVDRFRKFFACAENVIGKEGGR